jgi:hypothetical protein
MVAFPPNAPEQLQMTPIVTGAPAAALAPAAAALVPAAAALLAAVVPGELAELPELEQPAVTSAVAAAAATYQAKCL